MTVDRVIQEFLAFESSASDQGYHPVPERIPTLVYIYGPPASGKLTIARKVAALTGFPLFHNHLTVNAISSVFPFGSDAYKAVLHRLRLDVFARAVEFGVDLIFTNNSAWGGTDGRSRFAAFAEAARKIVEDQGGRTVFVRLTAPADTLEGRLADESRRANGKLGDVGRLRELLAGLDSSPLHDGDVAIDTSVTSPDGAAAAIAGLLGAPASTEPAGGRPLR